MTGNGEAYHDVLFGELLGEEGLEVLDGRLVVRKLVGRMLGVLRELERGVLRDRSLRGLEGAGDKVEEGGLSGSVGSEDGYTGVHTVKQSMSISNCVGGVKQYKHVLDTEREVLV